MVDLAADWYAKVGDQLVIAWGNRKKTPGMLTDPETSSG